MMLQKHAAALLLTASLLAPAPLGAQQVVWPCFGTSNADCLDHRVSSSNPLPVAATITPSGTQNVNLIQVGGATFALGQALMAAGIPVTIASNQSALTVTGAGGTFPVTQASGSVASGAYSSGAFASGAFASGSVASGAYASGALASGAMVDLVASQTPVAAGAATATKGLLLGGQFDTTQKTLTNGQQAAFSASARGALFVATGADTFTVTGAGGTFPVTAASGAFASGSIASGAVASGAYASGAFASGSIASGAIAAGAQVDLLTMRGTKAAGTAAANSILEGGVYNATTPAATDGQQVAAQIDQTGSRQVNTEGKKTTYSAAQGNTLVASTTDFFTILGSGTKTIRVTRVQVNGVATAASNFQLSVRKYSTAYSGGTPSAVTAVPHDSGNAAATAAVTFWTANPTVGSLVGLVRTQYWSFSTAATTAFNVGSIVFDFTTRNGQGIVLRGTSQYLSLNLGGATVTGGVALVDIEWTEE